MMHLEADVFRKFDKQWALVTAGTPEHYNTMTISWGGLGTLWRRPVATVYVKKNRYTFEFMEQNDYFTVSFYPEAQRRALSLLGSTSGSIARTSPWTRSPGTFRTFSIGTSRSTGCTSARWWTSSGMKALPIAPECAILRV